MLVGFLKHIELCFEFCNRWGDFYLKEDIIFCQFKADENDIQKTSINLNILALGEVGEGRSFITTNLPLGQASHQENWTLSLINNFALKAPYLSFDIVFYNGEDSIIRFER